MRLVECCSCAVPAGLLQLLKHDPDLLAMVMGHEMAHAIARHNTEKMGLGLAVSMILSMLVTVLGGGPDGEQQRQRQQQLENERMRRGYHRTHSRLVNDLMAPEGSSGYDQQQQGGGLPAGAMGAGYYPSVPRADVPPISVRCKHLVALAAAVHAQPWLFVQLCAVMLVLCLCSQQQYTVYLGPSVRSLAVWDNSAHGNECLLLYRLCCPVQ